MSKPVAPIDYQTIALMADKTTTGFMITNAEGMLEWVNEGFIRMTGYTLAEVVNRRAGDFLYGAHSDRVTIQRNSDLLKAGQGFEEELIFYRKDGSPFWGLISVSPIKDDQGQPERWIGLMMDITQKKNQEEQMISMQEEVLAMAEAMNTNMEQALKRAEANLYALTENTSDSLWLVGRDYELLIVNGVFRKNYAHLDGGKLQLGTSLLQQLARVVDGETLERYQSQYERAFSGEIFSVIESVSNGGETQFFEESYYPIRSDSGQVYGVSVFSKDITHLKKIEEELQQQKRTLIQANRELDTLVYRSAHDFMGPVASIKGLISLYRMEHQTSADNHYMEMIEACNLKLAVIIENLFQVTNIKEDPVRCEPIDFDALMAQVIESLNNPPPAVRLEYLNHLKTLFHSDAYRLRIILRNVMENSIRYAKKGRECFAMVEIHSLEKQILIEITDNGIGIEEKHLESVFDMFKRSNLQSSGTGLGLYVVKKAVERLSGRLELTSQLDKGTTLRIWVPDMA
jgi:PAS domain S-box-containing protein